MADTLSFPLPLIESGQVYAPASLALEVQNLRLTDGGTLEAIRGPCPYIPDRGSGYPWPGRIYGVFHTVLDGGQRDVTLVRSGTKLYELTGWTTNAGTGVRELASGLSDEPNARYPDQFVQVGQLIVWNNGIDAPLVYDGYGDLHALGYDIRPGAPSASGPTPSGHPVFRNNNGYNHPGKIGNIGDVYTNQSGALLPGIWYYGYQWEDFLGNRSPISAVSNGVTIRRELSMSAYWTDYTIYANDWLGFDTTPLGLNTVQLDDLQKQFVVSGIQKGPKGTKKKILFRSRNAELNPNTLHQLAEMDNETTWFPDNIPDASLGAPAVDYITVPRFEAMCAHKGCLVILEGHNVRISDPLYIGSFRKERYTPLPAEPRGVFSFGGNLYVATDTALHIVTDDGTTLDAKEVSPGFGLVGPNAVGGTGLGVLVGLGQDSWWAMSLDGKVTPLSRDIQPTLQSINGARAAHAWVQWSPRDREALCGVPEAGGNGNTLVMAYDGAGWRRRRYGMSMECATLTKDWRRYILSGARVSGVDVLMNLHGETYSYDGPDKKYVFKSQWLSPDPLKMKTFSLDFIYIGFVEAQKGNIDVTLWQNGTRDTSVVVDTRENIGNGGARDELFDTLVLGTGKARTPGVVWKKVPVHAKSVTSIAFDLSCSEPMHLHIAAFAIGVVVVDATGARVSKQ